MLRLYLAGPVEHGMCFTARGVVRVVSIAAIVSLMTLGAYRTPEVTDVRRLFVSISIAVVAGPAVVFDGESGVERACGALHRRARSQWVICICLVLHPQLERLHSLCHVDLPSRLAFIALHPAASHLFSP